MALFAGTWWSSRDTVHAAERVELERRYEDHLQAGFASLATRSAMDADASFLAALDLEPTSVEARIGRALARFDSNRSAEAVALLDGIPPSPALAAMQDFVARRPTVRDLGARWLALASALELYIDGLRLVAQAQRVPRFEGAQLFELAGRRFDEAVRRAPKARASYHIMRASACRETGDEAGARSAAAALATLWPDSPRALGTAAHALQKIDPDTALELVSRSIELDPSWAPLHRTLGNIHFNKQRYAESVAASSAAMRLDPRDAKALNMLGLAWTNLKCADEARSAFQAALSMEPNQVLVWQNFGDLEVGLRNLAGRETCLRMALFLDPRDAYSHERLAKLLQERKEPAPALDHVVTALSLAPENAWSWQVLAVVACDLGRVEDALWAAERAVELEPSNPNYRRLLDLVRELRARIERAHSAGTPR
jgi:tetratricopeptide (TPR) repeat protein